MAPRAPGTLRNRVGRAKTDFFRQGSKYLTFLTRAKKSVIFTILVEKIGFSPVYAVFRVPGGS